MRSGRFLFLL